MHRGLMAAHRVFIIQIGDRKNMDDVIIPLAFGGKCKQIRKQKIKNSGSLTHVNHHPIFWKKMQASLGDNGIATSYKIKIIWSQWNNGVAYPKKKTQTKRGNYAMIRLSSRPRGMLKLPTQTWGARGEEGLEFTWTLEGWSTRAFYDLRHWTWGRPHLEE